MGVSGAIYVEAETSRILQSVFLTCGILTDTEAQSKSVNEIGNQNRHTRPVQLTSYQDMVAGIKRSKVGA